MAEGTTQVTRVVRDGAGTQLAVRRARLTVVAGPDAGAALELGDKTVALVGTHPRADLCLHDDTVSRRHAELRAEPGGWRVVDLDSTNGVRIGGALITSALVDGGGELRLGQTTLALTLLDGEALHPLWDDDRFGSLVGASPEMKKLFALAARAAQSDATVLIHGESGTGKELLAEGLHRASARAGGPFVVVDCGNLVAGLADSELFGHEAGAFSGAATARAGLVEEAEGGTLFFDEVGELPAALQPKLLRLCEAREVRRVGADTSRKVDVRLVAATHRDLTRAVDEGRFRADLYFRLGGVKLTVPPLRHRPEDIAMLARHFVRLLAPDRDPDSVLRGALLGALASYGWPGNVRELRNVVERLCAVGELDSRVRASDAGAADYHDARRAALDRFERAYCATLLEEAGGSVGRAAERAGISRQMLHRIMRRHGLVG
ncbi:MAG: ATPase [Myxococcales bacterium]|nr:ATPase [Myxococcales bacterium]